MRNGGVETCNELDDDQDGQFNEGVDYELPGAAPPTIRAIRRCRPGLAPSGHERYEPTFLQAIAEGENNCTELTFRWDVNGDGDFNDANEGWRNAAQNSGVERYRLLGLSHTFRVPMTKSSTLVFKLPAMVKSPILVTVPYKTLGRQRMRQLSTSHKNKFVSVVNRMYRRAK